MLTWGALAGLTGCGNAQDSLPQLWATASCDVVGSAGCDGAVAGDSDWPLADGGTGIGGDAVAGTGPADTSTADAGSAAPDLGPAAPDVGPALECIGPQDCASLDVSAACMSPACIDGRCKAAIQPNGTPCYPEAVDACVVGACQAGQCAAQMKVCDDGDTCTDDTCDPGDGACHHVAIDGCAPESTAVADVSPLQLDFEQVKAGETPVKFISVSNTGSEGLLIPSILFEGHPDYRLGYQGIDWEPGDEVALNPPIEIAPGDTITFSVQFAPLSAVPAEAKVVFYTNDAGHPSGILVEITANTEGPCIQVNPQKVQFGGKLIGTKALLPVEILSCGAAPLDVSGIMFTDGSNPNFTLDYTTLPGFEDNSAPSGDNLLTIPVNNQATFNVVYEPSIESPLGEDAQPVFDVGTILIESNAFDDKKEIEVTGLGVSQECLTAGGVIQEGEQVIPQTNLHLFGDQSFAPAGAVASWKWTVQQPTGSASVFIPSDTFPNPTFEVNAAGNYEFSLEVWDEAGVKSCVPWKQSVVVIPDEAIHVELLWHTPNDPDETDQGPAAGADMDLHFVHDKYAASGPDLDQDGLPDVWFDQPFDCFWFNAHPNWGSFDPSIDDDPGLDRDDTDGAGPENLNLNIPENTTYRVGVHYWSDHGYGASFATLRIYIYGNLVFEVSDVELVNHDMWDAATIEWPSGDVNAVEQAASGYKITPAYQNPFFFQP